MTDYLTPLIQLQRFFIPGLVILLCWAIWRAVFHKDLAVGLALYLSLVIIADSYLLAGIFIPGLEKGSIHYSEVCAVFLLFNRPATSPRLPMRSLVIGLVFVYFALLFASALRSDSPVAAIFEFRRWMVPQIVAFVVAIRGIDGPQAFRRFFLCLTALFMIAATFTFWDLFFDRVFLKSEMLHNGIYWFNREKNRFGSFFLNPNSFGAFVVLVFPAAFVWTTLERRYRLYAWAGLLALIFSLVETQSRSAVLAFGIAVLVLVLGPCGEISRRRRLGFLALFAIACTLALPGAFNRAVNRFDDMRTETSGGRSRQATWEYTLRIIGDHSISGIGFGEQQFVRYMKDYGFEEEFGVEPLDAPHNSYLQAAVYAGIPALAVFLLANLLVLGKALRRALLGASNAESATVFGLAVGILGFLACVFTDLQLFTPHVGAVYWVFFGLLLSVITKTAEAEAPAPVWAAQPRSAFQMPNQVSPRSARATVDV